MRVSKMTSQRTRSWNVARRQLAKGDFVVCERSMFFHVAQRELTKVHFEVRAVYTFRTSWYQRQYYDEVIYWASRCLYIISRLPSMKCVRALFSVCLSFFVKSQLGLVRVTRETTRDRQRGHPSKRGLTQTERLRAYYRHYSWSYWAGIWDIRRGSQRAFDMLENLIRVVGSDAPDSFTAYY